MSTYKIGDEVDTEIIVSLDDMIDSEFEDFLDIVADRALEGHESEGLLTDFSYVIAGVDSEYTLRLRVRGVII